MVIGGPGVYSDSVRRLAEVVWSIETENATILHRQVEENLVLGQPSRLSIVTHKHALVRYSSAALHFAVCLCHSYPRGREMLSRVRLLLPIHRKLLRWMLSHNGSLALYSLPIYFLTCLMKHASHMTTGKNLLKKWKSGKVAFQLYSMVSIIA